MLLAALLHASWNAILKASSGRETHRILTPALVVGTASLGGLALTPFVVPPAPESWPYLALSAIIHTGYFSFLVLAYRFGDLSQVYPIARGLSPLLVAPLVGPLAGEALGLAAGAGVLLIALGVGSLALGRTHGAGRDPRAILFAFATGATIGAFTITDALGVRAAGSALGYVAWVNFLMSAPFAAGAFLLARREARVYLRDHWRPGVLAGLMTVTSYGLIVWTLSLGAIAPIAALRETSVVFGAAMGALFLGEPFGRRRVLAAAVVAGGIVLLHL
ncbi:MAG: DMT family transporter [Alphaproteobacteria bacterium]|nr:DMT family transporter [Alphaproteobacteria bacterium]